LPCTYSFLMYTSVTPPLVLPFVRTVIVPPLGVAVAQPQLVTTASLRMCLLTVLTPDTQAKRGV